MIILQDDEYADLLERLLCYEKTFLEQITHSQSIQELKIKHLREIYYYQLEVLKLMAFKTDVVLDRNSTCKN